MPLSIDSNQRRSDDADALRVVHDSETVHRATRRTRIDDRGRLGQLNLTAMMDVTFQLLIFFVLTAAFALNEGVLRADLPTGPAQPRAVEIPREPINIVLRMNDAQVLIDVNGQFVGNMIELYNFLSGNNQALSANGIYGVDEPIVIKPRNKVPWGAVLGAFNAATRAKYTNINFAQAGSG